MLPTRDPCTPSQPETIALTAKGNDDNNNEKGRKAYFFQDGDDVVFAVGLRSGGGYSRGQNAVSKAGVGRQRILLPRLAARCSLPFTTA